jgi:hypothetical protein
VRNEEAIAPISRFLMLFNRGPRRSLWRALEPCRTRSWCHNCDLIKWCLLRFAICSLVTNPHGIVADTSAGSSFFVRRTASESNPITNENHFYSSNLPYTVVYVSLAVEKVGTKD